MTLFGTPAILALPAGVDTMTTKIWSLFQFPPQLGLAAAASLPLLLITVVLLRDADRDHGPARLLGHRRQEHAARGSIRLGPWKVPALALFVVVLGCSIVLPYGVLLRTAFVKNWSAPVIGNFSLEHWRFVFFEFSQTKLGVRQHLRPRRHRGDRGHDPGDDDRLPEPAQARVGPSLPRVPRDRTGRDPRHRAGRRPVPQLHAAAAGALRNACGSSSSRI